MSETRPAPARTGTSTRPGFAVHGPSSASDGAAVLVLEGELDIATAPELDRRLRETEASAARIVLDLREVPFMDSTGLAAILSCCDRHLRRGDQGPALVVADGQVRRLLELTGCHALIEDAAALG